MTDTTNGWPGKPGVPLNPGQTQWHWLKGAASLSKPRPYLWEVFFGSGRWADKRLNDPVILAEMEYIRPALPYGLTHDQATALQARVAELDARLERLMGPPPDKTKLRVGLIAAGISEKTADEILSSPTFNRAALEGKKDE